MKDGVVTQDVPTRANPNERARAMVWSVGQVQAMRASLEAEFPQGGPAKRYAVRCLMGLLRAEES